MITIRNPNECRARTVVAGEALKVGQFVKLVQAAVKGDPCKVTKVVAADLVDASKVIGIVDYVPDTDLAIDYLIDPTNSALSLNTGADNTTDIPNGAMCLFWYDQPIVGFTKDSLHSTYQTSFDNIREADVVAINSTSALLDAYVAGTPVAGARTVVATPNDDNTGNGTCDTPAATTAVAPQIFTLTASGATSFEVVGSVDGILADATVGAAYSQSGLSFTLTAGGTPFAAGDVFVLVVTAAAGTVSGNAAVVQGLVYQHEGAEITVMLTKI